MNRILSATNYMQVIKLRNASFDIHSKWEQIHKNPQQKPKLQTRVASVLDSIFDRNNITPSLSTIIF